ncbi:MAG: hypothetical protein AW07_02312 [Candidatus Accumulibacter sp. SK-11]|nr:MAG: hypothetical protein AW07_02312 [Candidatus Accumulibacter sp. SK-11]
MTLAAALASTLAPSARADRPRHGGQPTLSRALLAGACWLLAMPAPAQSVDAPVAATDGVASAATSEAPAPRQRDRFYFQTSLYTAHFHPDDEHNNSQKLVYAEWRLPQRWLEGQVLVGGSYFENSYYQSSQFVFAGLLWRPAESMQELYLKLGSRCRARLQGAVPGQDPLQRFRLCAGNRSGGWLLLPAGVQRTRPFRHRRRDADARRDAALTGRFAARP